MTGFKAVVAIAFVRARQVDAKSVLTQIRVVRALVDIPALFRAHLHVSFGADARERTDQIFTRVFTVVGRRLALVHVCSEQNKYKPQRTIYTNRLKPCRSD